MASTSTPTMTEIQCPVRSISMPTRSHPNTLKIEDALSKLKTSDSSGKAQTISIHLTTLVELYNGVEDLLQLPLTQQVLSQFRQHEKWVEYMLDASVRVLDVCSTARDVLLKLKEQAQDLRTSLRRRGSEASKEQKVDAYISFRKKMKKYVSKCIAELNRMNNKCVASPPLLDQDQHLEMVIKVLKEVEAITISFFQCLTSLMYSTTPKSKRWSLVSILKHERQVACEGELEDMSELQCVDVVLLSLSHSSKHTNIEAFEKAQKGLEALEHSIEGLDSGLECLFKYLIQFRVSLLNIFTH